MLPNVQSKSPKEGQKSGGVKSFKTVSMWHIWRVVRIGKEWIPMRAYIAQMQNSLSNENLSAYILHGTDKKLLKILKDKTMF